MTVDRVLGGKMCRRSGSSNENSTEVSHENSHECSNESDESNKTHHKDEYKREQHHHSKHDSQRSQVCGEDALVFVPLHSTIGAEVRLPTGSSLDLRRSISPSMQAQIHHALLRYGMLLFRKVTGPRYHSERKMNGGVHSERSHDKSDDNSSDMCNDDDNDDSNDDSNDICNDNNNGDSNDKGKDSHNDTDGNDKKSGSHSNDSKRDRGNDNNNRNNIDAIRNSTDGSNTIGIGSTHKDRHVRPISNTDKGNDVNVDNTTQSTNTFDDTRTKTNQQAPAHVHTHTHTHARTRTHTHVLHLTPTEQVRFTRIFGELETFKTRGQAQLAQHTDVFRVSNRTSHGAVDVGLYWHSDGAFKNKPPLVTAWHIIQLPEEGVGDTQFTSLHHRYTALSPQMKRQVKGKMALDRTQFVRHPLTRTHPATGKECLYVNFDTMKSIQHASAEESRNTFAALERHLSEPESYYTHAWRDGDLIVGDQYSIAHRATPAHNAKRVRVLHRTTVKHSTVFWKAW